MSATTVHPIQKFGTSGGIQQVNPNSRVWQAYLGLGYQGIRTLVRRRWPSQNQAAAAATLTSLTPNTAVAGSTSGSTTVAVVGTGFVAGATVFVMDDAVVSGNATSATAASIGLPNGAVGAHQVRAINPGRLPSAPSTFTVTTPPPGEMATPTQSSTKAQIVAWLLDHGVALSEDTLAHLTKDELLELVDDVLSP